MYWIASACDKILAADTAILGSIGVVSIFEKDDDGKTIEIVSSQSQNKRPDINTEEGKAKIQARVDELAEVLIAKVAVIWELRPLMWWRNLAQAMFRLANMLSCRSGGWFNLFRGNNCRL